MTEDFVSFDLAKKLKEKGFNQPCLAHYTNGKFEYNIAYFEEVELVDLYELWNNAGCFVDAPTISQVLKWLREEKKIHISIITYDYTWGYTVYDLDTFFPEEFSSYYNTYEEATLAGIEYVLDNLI